MLSWSIELAITVVVAASVAFALWIWLCSIRWRRQTQKLVNQLYTAATPNETATISFADFEQLPEPVARYFRFVLTDGQPPIKSAEFNQAGELRSNERQQRWSTFSAQQIVSPVSQGFVWSAAVRLAPGLHVRVRDAFVHGQGMGQVSFQSLFTLANEKGGAELNSASLQRFLAEAVWYPTALLPNAGVVWSTIDNDKALATLTDSGTTVQLEFHFNEAGEVVGVYSPGRYRRNQNGYELTAWEGHFAEYQEYLGMRVPTKGEVGWHLSGLWQPVWKGKILDIHYTFAN